MAKYRTKQIIKEAIQYTGKNEQEIIDFCQGNAYFKPAPIDSPLMFTTSIDSIFAVDSLEKKGLEILVNDYVIKGIKGEFYPCKPDIFKKTYELVEE